MNEMVNLAVDLSEHRFDDAALVRTLEAIEAAGFVVERVRKGDDVFLAWLDEEFGGTWSSEAFAGSSVIARERNGKPAGFATYDPRGLQFSWLRGLGAEDGVGVFGPFGVARAHRKSRIGPLLLIAALASLRERGYARALIPAVGAEKLIEYYVAHSGAHIAERFDKQSWFERRYRTTVLVSGGGTNLQAVLDGSAQGRLPLDVRAVISNVENAYALTRARNSGLETVRALPWNR
ncbi:MAG: GNAT family N-acetyltransferase, partial [Candidatus Eremiobacteraeota bacterium]|nr:GNAT family N-acetyltransferase [Candidatus Eremiobacteraeota bacterium]